MIPDRHPANVSAARTFALKNADAILLAGARLNWVPHFGLPPRFRPDLRFVQIDIALDARRVPQSHYWLSR